MTWDKGKRWPGNHESCCGHWDKEMPRGRWFSVSCAYCHQPYPREHNHNGCRYYKNCDNLSFTANLKLQECLQLLKALLYGIIKCHSLIWYQYLKANILIIRSTCHQVLIQNHVCGLITSKHHYHKIINKNKGYSDFSQRLNIVNCQSDAFLKSPLAYSHY